MARAESYAGVSLLPIVIAAGILSGTLFRQSSPPEASKQPSKPPESLRFGEDLPATSWLSDLRPVMETMGDALGLSLHRDDDGRTAGITASELETLQPAKVIEAIFTIRSELQSRLSNDSNTCEPNAPDDSLTSAAQTLNAYLLSDKDSDSPSRKLRSSVAEAALNEWRDWRSFVTLARHVRGTDNQHGPAYQVQFIVATIPDYVDSNAGWFADQNLAAIQSALSRSRYVLDRFRLIDWTRRDPRSDTPVVSDSRLHERQPGVLVFRRQEGEIGLVVVLLALETPTSGVHRTALRNGIRFIRAWNRCSGAGSTTDLRVLGPTFSGSSLSVALTLGDPIDQFGAAFSRIHVMSGSATADENPGVFVEFAPANTSFAAAVPPTSETKRIMSAYLGRMNPAWQDGRHVAILLESNTAYGQTSPRSGDGQTSRSEDRRQMEDPFRYASVFYFPLHLSQLRNDAPAATAPTVTLLPTPTVQLNMRETTPPADQIPALRPQLTSSVVESTVNTILDTIRHEQLSAVGIQATDERDVLFLAREVKRAAPDVQLFFLGAHALYLHQDYIPYLRGTLIASPYSLSLTTQAGFAEADARGREPFQSMAAEGLFNATLLLGDLHSKNLLDYCNPGTVSGPCTPPVAISVIGKDGFWPLAGIEETNLVTGKNGSPYVQPADPKLRFSARGLPPLPTQARIVITLLGVFVLANVLMVLVIDHQLGRGVPARRFLSWPVLSVLVPPVTYPSALTAHRLALLMCFVIVAALSGWMVAGCVPIIASAGKSGQTLGAALLIGGLVLVPVARLTLISRRPQGMPRNWPQAVRKRSSWMLLPALGLFLLTISAFVIYLADLMKQPSSDLDLTLGRLVGGGIVSPAPATLCLFAGLYVCMFAAARRASLVGKGYTQLEERSPAFALLTGSWGSDEKTARAQQDGARLGDVLDLPAQNLPLMYVIAILLVMLIAGYSFGKVSTIDGQAFGWFLAAGSATVLMLALTNLAQGLVIWNTARVHLKWLAMSPIEGAFKSIAGVVPWDLSLAPPRLMELLPLARRADAIIPVLPAVSWHMKRSRRVRALSKKDRPGSTNEEQYLVVVNSPHSEVKILERETRQQQQAAFMHSSSWWHLWSVSDAIVEMLKTESWGKAAPSHIAAAAPAGLPVFLTMSSLPEPEPAASGISTRVKLAAVIEASADSHMPAAHAVTDERAGLFRSCEEFVALQFAFVLRDVVARTVAALFTAMLSLTLLTAAHLLYSFNPRSSLLTVDLLAVGAASVTSIWILVGMEREPVLSRLRHTTPGRLDINWAFVQRLATYGVLPLLAVLASLFPEIGNTMFGWLEPLRKLANF